MANCRRFGHRVTNLCGTPAGVKEIYLANYSDLINYWLDTDEVIISGMTLLSLSHPWYKITIDKQSSLFITEAIINIPNGVALSSPKLEFKVSGLDEIILNLYNQLKQVTCIAVVRTLDDNLYALGFQNGLDTVNCTIGTSENRVDGFKGATFSMKGTEKDPMYQLDPSGIALCFPNCPNDVTYSIGDLTGGGVVFYVYDGGHHGKIVSLYDVQYIVSGSTNLGNSWGCRGTLVGATGTP